MADVGIDGVIIQQDALFILERRITDFGRSSAHERDGLMPRFLKPMQHHNARQIPDMQGFRRGIKADIGTLHPFTEFLIEGFKIAALVDKPTLGQYVQEVGFVLGHWVFIIMGSRKVYRAIGLMSGTSLDGEVDVALIETDGQDYVKPMDFKPYRYGDHIRDIVRPCFGKRVRDAQVQKAEDAVTDVHIRAVKESGFEADIVGFHGQTITHDPSNRFTWQIGDGQRLARETGMDVIADMRQADVKAGGEGAPLLPLYHRARCADFKKPVVILNIGGVANITYIDTGGILAFDCGPGNALMDDFIKARTGQDYDRDGALAMTGMPPDQTVLRDFFMDAYFKKPPPKSLDRDMWSADLVQDLATAQGMATLLCMTTGAIAAGFEKLPAPPVACYVCGGGRKNTFLMDTLKALLLCAVEPVEALAWNGDATEAEGFAYLAVRSLLGLPLTEPTTTGVPQAMTGGVLYKATS